MHAPELNASSDDMKLRVEWHALKESRCLPSLSTR